MFVHYVPEFCPHVAPAAAALRGAASQGTGVLGRAVQDRGSVSVLCVDVAEWQTSWSIAPFAAAGCQVGAQKWPICPCLCRARRGMESGGLSELRAQHWLQLGAGGHWRRLTGGR